MTLIFLFQHDPLKIVFFMIALAFIVLFWLGHRKGKLDWTDLITGKGTNKVALTKLLQLIGGISGTWIVIYQTMHDKLSSDIFLTYLAYVGAIDAWSKFVAARYGGISAIDTGAPVTTPTVTDTTATTTSVSVAATASNIVSATSTPTPLYGPKVPGV